MYLYFGLENRGWHYPNGRKNRFKIRIFEGIGLIPKGCRDNSLIKRDNFEGVKLDQRKIDQTLKLLKKRQNYVFNSLKVVFA